MKRNVEKVSNILDVFFPDKLIGAKRNLLLSLLPSGKNWIFRLPGR